MHLTNYSINKSNPGFIHNKDFRKDNIGHKRSISSVYSDIEAMGGDSEKIKGQINHIIVKTILAVYKGMTTVMDQAGKRRGIMERGNNKKNGQSKGISHKKHIHRSIVTGVEGLGIQGIDDDLMVSSNTSVHSRGISDKEKTPFTNKLKKQIKGSHQIDNQGKCFELLGFDIMLLDNFEPKLIQVNHQPSLQTGSPLDYIIKKYLLIDIFNLLNINSMEKKTYLDKLHRT